MSDETIDDLSRERDALEAALDEHRARRKAAEVERDAAHQRAEQAERERDEARAALARLREVADESAHALVLAVRANTPADLAAELVRVARVEGARLMREAACAAIAERRLGVGVAFREAMDEAWEEVYDLDPAEVVRAKGGA